MDVQSIFEAGGTVIKNPNYSKNKKNIQPEYITVSDLDSDVIPTGSAVSRFVYDAAAKGHQDILGRNEELDKYIKAGYTPNDWQTFDKQLADRQSNSSKIWNAVKQTLYSELLLGTIQGFADIADVISGEVFRSDNDYQNPVSSYLENLRQQFREDNPIYVDPDKNIFNGGLHDVGWWASNAPSIISSLTLLLPARGVTGAVSLIGKATKLNKGISWTRKALTGARNINTIEQAEKLGKIGKWANKQSTITAANRMFENGLTAAAMRTMENYQEARQTYNDMYKEASDAFNRMNTEEYNNFLKNNEEELSKYNVDLNNRDAVAKLIASNAADKTFVLDYSNLLFDVIQVNALRNPLKLSKNMRQTAPIRKAERLAKQQVGKSAEEIAKLEANLTTRQRLGNFFKDHAGAYKVWFAESTEGIEEAVNYIAQQEGMTYGRVMIDPENNPQLDWNSRLSSYLASPELYDAAFWGVLGGVVFNSGGSAINRATNIIKGKWAEKQDKKKHNTDKTEETTNTNWKSKYETPENKARIAEIDGRLKSFNTLANRLTLIEDGKDPFNRDVNNPALQATLTSDTEAQVARDRAIDEYIVDMTFRALDNGQYDALKAYLRDENVRKALADKGVIEDTGNEKDVEELIRRMDEIEQIYNDHLIAIDGISQAFGDIPFEYVQIIARDNAKAQIQSNRLAEQIANYETSADNNARRFGGNLDSSIDYKSAVQLVITARRLAMLRAKEKEILKDKDYASSIDGQVTLRDVRNEIKLINENLMSDTWTNSPMTSSFSNSLARFLWANGISTQGFFNEQGELKNDVNANEYVDFLSHLSSLENPESQEALVELTGVDFEITDSHIDTLFGDLENGRRQGGIYSVLNEDINAAFDIEKGLDKKAPNLNEDYQTIAALKIAKLSQDAKIAKTTETINSRIDELHNIMNEARVKAINKAQKTIFDLAKKYDNFDVIEYIFSNEEIEGITYEDKKDLDDALEVLNLTAPSNQVLAENLRGTLIFAKAQQNSQNAIENQQNSTNQNQSSANSQLNQSNISPQSQNPSAAQANGSQGQQPQQNQQPQSQQSTTRMRVSGNINNELNVEKDIPNYEVGYTYTENPDGTIQLSFPEGLIIPQKWLQDSELYEGYDANRQDKPKVASYPIIAQDENGKYSVVQKGVLSYENNANMPSSIPSTGEGVAPSSPDTETPATEAPLNPGVPSNNNVRPESKASNEVAPVSIDDETIEEIQNNIQREANAAFKNRDKSLDAAEVLDNIINDLREAHKNDENQQIVQQAINRADKIIRSIATRRGLIKAAGEVLTSSVTEMPNGKYDFSQEYKDAVVKMIEAYCKENGIREINGKYYINLEDTLRRINTLYEDKGIAEMMFGAMKAYLNTKEAKDKFVIKDDINSSEFLNNVKKSSKERIAEKIGLREDKTHRVFIDRLFKNPTKEFLKVFDSINKGDKLSFKVVNDEIHLTKDGVKIGSLPKPLVNDRGGYYKYNNGWKTDVSKEGNVIVSSQKTLFDIILTEDNDVAKEINDSITELNYSNPTESRKKELIDKIYDKLENDFQLVEKNGMISPSTDKEEVVNYMTKLWKYFDTRSETPEERNANILDSLDLWFEKLYDEYNSISQLTDIVKDNEVEFTVEKISSGELIRNVNSDTRGNGNNYELFTQSNEALANPDEVDFGIVDINNGRIITLTNGSTIELGELKNSGTPHIVFHNKDGNNNFVVGTSVRFNDKKLKGDAKEIFSAIKSEVEYLVDKHIADGNYEDLYNFLRELIYTTSKTGIVRGMPNNTGLLSAIGIIKQKDDANGFTMFNSGYKTNLNVHNKESKKTFSYKRVTDENWKTGDLTNTEDAKLFKELINEILDSSVFNISTNYIDGDINRRQSSGLATHTNDGRFVITIPNSANSNNSLVKIYPSFKDAVLKGGLIRVNTHQENGRNYQHKGDNQAYNQTLEVSFNKIISSPVEDNQSTDSNVGSNAEQILKDNTIKDKANTLLENVMTEEQLKSLNELHLLPENIIFDENFNSQDDNGNYTGLNALARLKSKETVVGRRWLDMFNEEGQFAGYMPGEMKRQAIRKLIHEQLHHKLQQRGRKEYLAKIEEIYNDFKNSLDNADEATKAKIEKYLFNDEIEAGRKYIALEEFLVESLTSGELVNYLNSVQVDFEKNKKLSNNLWQKILKVLGDIFGWEVTKGSLREKELHALQSQIKHIQEGLDNIGKEETKQETKPARRKRKEVKPTKNPQTRQLNIFDDIETNKQQEPIKETVDSTQEVTNDEQDLSDVDINDIFGNIFGNDTETRGSSNIEIPTNYTPEMQSIKDKAITDGTFMKAPNGNPTNLNERQWLQVRTESFKNWFGDWLNPNVKTTKTVEEKVGKSFNWVDGSDVINENGTYFYINNYGKKERISKDNYEAFNKGELIILNTKEEVVLEPNPNVSKVLDENGEPLVMYHRTDDNITKFDITKSHHGGFWFSRNPDYYKETKAKRKNALGCFLNIRNPNTINHETFEAAIDGDSHIEGGLTKNDGWVTLNVTSPEFYGDEGSVSIVFAMATKSNQIKSATDNNGGFSTTDNDIRHSSVTEQFAEVETKLKSEVQTFLDNFSINLNEVNEFEGGQTQLFDALNRTINISKPEDITDGVGYAVAFMMQWDNRITDLIRYKLAENNGKGIRRSLKIRGDFSGVSLKGLNKETKQEWLKEIGKDIAVELRKYYDVSRQEDKSNTFISKIWDIIKEFFNILTPEAKAKFNAINNYTKEIARSIKENNPSIVLSSDIKPGTTEVAERQDINKAFEENPYEREIIDILNDNNIALAGSASIALEGSLFRPKENPLHDIDFNAVGYNKEGLDNLINKKFPNNSFIREIVNNPNKKTETYLILDRPFKLVKSNSIDAEYDIIDKETGEKLGDYLKSNLRLNDNVKGKFLDFFIGNENRQYPNKTYNINGKDYLISDYRNAMKFKIEEQRDKDIWDYNRFNPNTRQSSITESPVQHPSISEFTQTLPIQLQAEFIASVAQGEIETACR